jgi:heptaprenyl diphosphate synthase
MPGIQSMPSPNKMAGSDLAAKTALLLLAVGINALEYFFPRIPFLPWLKPGLANVVTIIWILRWGATDAIIFTALRSWITSFYFGFSLVSLVLSMSGGIAAALGMGVLWTLFGKRRWLGLVGLGIAGAVLHNSGQLCAIYFLLTATTLLWYQLPFMLGASLVFGAVTGILAYALAPRLAAGSREVETDCTGFASPPIRNFALRFVGGGFLLSASVAVVFLHAPAFLGVAAAAATILAVAAARGNLAMLVYPVARFWLLFAFIGIMDTFFSYGRTAFGLSFVTHEGLRETGLQWLRLWTWIELSAVLASIQFNRAVLSAAVRHVPFGRTTLTASLFALELFPAVFDLLRKRPKIDARAVFRDPKGSVKSTIERLYGDIVTLIEGNGEEGK